MDFDALRRDYRAQRLDHDDLRQDPLEQFELWFAQALKAELLEPNAMSLATASKGGAPSLRTVLLKVYDERGFVFFTNYQSTKAKQIAKNLSEKAASSQAPKHEANHSNVNKSLTASSRTFIVFT